MKLSKIFAKHKRSLGLVYALSLCADLIYLVMPAISASMLESLQNNSMIGVAWFVATYFVWTIISSIRKYNDTIVFTMIYNRIAIKFAQSSKLSTDIVDARLSLLSDIIVFFEYDIPTIIYSIVTIIGISVTLFYYSPVLMLACFMVVIPAVISNLSIIPKLQRVTAKINNASERQHSILASKNNALIQIHFDHLRIRNIQKSTLEVLNFAIMEIFIPCMVAICAYISVSQNLGIVNTVAITSYAWRLAYSFDIIPYLTKRIIVIRDIQKRFEINH